MQIAFFAVSKLSEEERGESKFAKMTCDLLFKGKGRNLAGFMIGRQLCVVSCFFVVARVTTLNIGEDDENIFGVSDGLQKFFNLGFLGALITTILASISWQLVASAFPLLFLANPLTYVFLRLCLLLEATGLASGAWVIAAIHKKIAGFQRDEVYIGTSQERAKNNNKDNSQRLKKSNMAKLPTFALDSAPSALKKLMEINPVVREFIKALSERNPDIDLSKIVLPEGMVQANADKV